MAVPTDRRYTESHEWCKADGDLMVVGLTQYAVDQLTDITFVQLSAAGAQVKAGQPCGEMESVKSAADLYAPISGEVVQANPALTDDPGLVNRDPFGDGWFIQIRPTDPTQLDQLLDAAAYEAMTAG